MKEAGLTFDPTPRPIFIIGAPRSGTSVLTWALGQHPDIALLPETVWFPTIAQSVRTAFSIGSARGDFSHLSNALFPESDFAAEFGRAIDRIARQSFERRIERHLPNFRERAAPPSSWAENPRARLIHHPSEPKRRWIDGTPENSFHGYALTFLFPEARFIHALRDPLEVATSLAHFDRAGGDAVVRRGEEGLRLWIRYTEAAWRIERALGHGRVYRLRNEELRNDGEAILRSCLDFLSESYVENCMLPLMGEMNSSKVTTDEKAAIRERLSRTRTYRKAAELHREIVAAPVPVVGAPALFGELRHDFERLAGEASVSSVATSF